MLNLCSSGGKKTNKTQGGRQRGRSWGLQISPFFNPLRMDVPLATAGGGSLQVAQVSLESARRISSVAKRHRSPSDPRDGARKVVGF